MHKTLKVEVYDNQKVETKEDLVYQFHKKRVPSCAAPAAPLGESCQECNSHVSG